MLARKRIRRPAAVLAVVAGLLRAAVSSAAPATLPQLAGHYVDCSSMRNM